MQALHGITVYSSGTLTATGNSGWQRWPVGNNLIEGGSLALVPTGLAGGESMALVLSGAADPAGADGAIIHTFTTVTSSNAAEYVQLNEISGIINWSTAGSSAITRFSLPPYFRLVWTIVGTPSMSFVLSGTLGY